MEQAAQTVSPCERGVNARVAEFDRRAHLLRDCRDNLEENPERRGHGDLGALGLGPSDAVHTWEDKRVDIVRFVRLEHR